MHCATHCCMLCARVRVLIFPCRKFVYKINAFFVAVRSLDIPSSECIQSDCFHIAAQRLFISFFIAFFLLFFIPSRAFAWTTIRQPIGYELCVQCCKLLIHIMISNIIFHIIVLPEWLVLYSVCCHNCYFPDCSLLFYCGHKNNIQVDFNWNIRT